MDRAPRSFQHATAGPLAGTGDLAILETAMYQTADSPADEELQRALQEAINRRD